MPATHLTHNPESSYDPAYFSRLFKIEDGHFWFRARNLTIATLVRQVVEKLAPGYRVLEVGCGTGNVLRVLEDACSDGTVIGMDLFNEGLQFARRRSSCPLVQGDMNTPAFSVQFDLIGIFDVLEHLRDDVKVLHDLRNLLKPGGALLLTVPAHPALWSYFDDASHHCRRYGFAELETKLISSGYRIEFMTQYMASIFPFVWLGRKLAALTHRQGNVDVTEEDALAATDLRIIPVLNKVLLVLLGLESRVIARRRSLPAGTSLIAVARKN